MAPMSTTTDLSVALRYAVSNHTVLFRLVTNSAMDRGGDLSFLSACMRIPHTARACVSLTRDVRSRCGGAQLTEATCGPIRFSPRAVRQSPRSESGCCRR